MGNKNQYPNVFSWQSTNPQTGFLPNNNQNSGGSKPSGVTAGVMSGTSTIYSNIIEKSRMDNLGYEVAWTGTPTGTLTILVSNSGINWPSLTFSPLLAQPSGSAGFMGIDMNQIPFKYIMLKYVNSSGSGTLSVYGQNCDVN